jgi:hypothetical protein
MSELEARKKLLVAESEVYRELLKLEIQNFRIYGKKTQRKLSLLGTFQTYLPMMMSGIPVAATLFGRKQRFSFQKFGSLLFLGWKAYNQFGSHLKGIRKQVRTRRTAAEEFLSKRI